MPDLEVRAQRTERQHDAFDVLAAQCDDGRRGAGVGNRHQLRARERVDQLHAEIADRAGAGMADAHPARVLLRVLDQFREAPERRVAAHDEDARRSRSGAERHQVAQRIVGSRLRVENGAKGERAVLREQDRLAVLLRLDDACAPTAPPAPGRLTSSTGTFSSRESSSPMARAAMSAASPGASGITTLIGPVGNDCAWADTGRQATATAQGASAARGPASPGATSCRRARPRPRRRSVPWSRRWPDRDRAAAHRARPRA